MDLEELRRLATSPDAQDRRRAAREAERSADLRTVALIVPLARDDADAAVRFVAQQALRVFTARLEEVMEELRSVPDLAVAPRLTTAAPRRSQGSGPAAADLHAADATERHRACKELADQRDPAAVRRLLEALASEGEGWVRAEIAWAIGVLGGGEGAQPALEGLLADPVSRARANAVEALQLIGARGFEEHCLPLLEDKDRRVRSNAALVLAEEYWHRAKPVLAGMATSKDRLDRMAVLFALQHIPAQKSRPILKEMQADPDLEIRKRVRGMLGDDGP